MSLLISVLAERPSQYEKPKKDTLNSISYNPKDNTKDLSHIDKFLKVISQNSKLDIVYKDVETAFINTVTQQITLPLYILSDRDLYLLMGTHEVSHALNTPMDFYKSHNSNKKQKIYGVELNKNLFNCINIVEDIRIEKLIRNQFPGFVAVYKRAYKKLLDGNKHWRLNQSVWDSLNLSNKINAKSKMGDLIQYEMTPDEEAVLKYMKTAKSFTDVLVRSVYLYKREMVQILSINGNLSDKAKGVLDDLDMEIGEMQEASDSGEGLDSSSLEKLIKKMLDTSSKMADSIEDSLESETGEDLSEAIKEDIIEESREKFAESKQNRANGVNFNAHDSSYAKIVRDPFSALS